MRIIILTDSLGRPRPDISTDEKTEYQDVYGYKVREFFAEHWVELIYIESLDTEDAIFWNERMVAMKRPDIVIYQIGINDCVPRIFAKGSNSILLKSWFRIITQDIFFRIIHKYRSVIIRSLRKKVYVNNDLYRKNYLKMIADVKHYNKNCVFFCLSIAGQPEEKELRSPGITANVKEYNRILEKIFLENYIDIEYLMSNKPENYLISDGIHFKKSTHELIFQELIKRINKVV